jgi:hypothetical protein
VQYFWWRFIIDAVFRRGSRAASLEAAVRSSFDGSSFALRSSGFAALRYVRPPFFSCSLRAHPWPIRFIPEITASVLYSFPLPAFLFHAARCGINDVAISEEK